MTGDEDDLVRVHQIQTDSQEGDGQVSFAQPLEDVVLSEDLGAGNRGDEGVLEGAVIKDSDEVLSDSDDDEDAGIIIHAGRTTAPSLRRYSRPGSRTYVRPQFISPVAVQNDPQEVAPPRKTTSEEIKKLRFQKNITAFDVDIDALDSHPWRNKNADISYYFNYGFTEKTWLNYCEEQLKLRAKKGLGPQPIPQPNIVAFPATGAGPSGKVSFGSSSGNATVTSSTAPNASSVPAFGANHSTQAVISVSASLVSPLGNPAPPPSGPVPPKVAPPVHATDGNAANTDAAAPATVTVQSAFAPSGHPPAGPPGPHPASAHVGLPNVPSGLQSPPNMNLQAPPGSQGTHGIVQGGPQGLPQNFPHPSAGGMFPGGSFGFPPHAGHFGGYPMMAPFGAGPGFPHHGPMGGPFFPQGPMGGPRPGPHPFQHPGPGAMREFEPHQQQQQLKQQFSSDHPQHFGSQRGSFPGRGGAGEWDRDRARDRDRGDQQDEYGDGIDRELQVGRDGYHGKRDGNRDSRGGGGGSGSHRESEGGRDRDRSSSGWGRDHDRGGGGSSGGGSGGGADEYREGDGDDDKKGSRSRHSRGPKRDRDHDEFEVAESKDSSKERSRDVAESKDASKDRSRNGDGHRDKKDREKERDRDRVRDRDRDRDRDAEESSNKRRRSRSPGERDKGERDRERDRSPRGDKGDRDKNTGDRERDTGRDKDNKGHRGDREDREKGDRDRDRARDKDRDRDSDRHKDKDRRR